VRRLPEGSTPQLPLNPADRMPRTPGGRPC
jgi:hypothetical protein